MAEANLKKPKYRVKKFREHWIKISGNKIKDFFEGSTIPAGEKDGLKVTFGMIKFESKRQLIFWKKADNLYARDLQSETK